MPRGVYVRTQKHLDIIKKSVQKRDKTIYTNSCRVQKIKEAARKNYRDPEYRIRHKEGCIKNSYNLDWINKMKEVNQKKSKDIIWIENHKKGIKKRFDNPIWKQNMIESDIGGFWYGNVRYKGERERYCELWNSDLWERIDAFWNNKSSLSGIPRNGKKLDRHHVYYNKKSCCLENGDGSFSVIIDDQIYPIIGDPNKFVLLTHSEHGKIKGSLNKIWYMRYFEWLINTNYNGKSYYTKDEYDKLVGEDEGE